MFASYGETLANCIAYAQDGAAQRKVLSDAGIVAVLETTQKNLTKGRYALMIYARFVAGSLIDNLFSLSMYSANCQQQIRRL